MARQQVQAARDARVTAALQAKPQTAGERRRRYCAAADEAGVSRSYATGYLRFAEGDGRRCVLTHGEAVEMLRQTAALQVEGKPRCR